MGIKPSVSASLAGAFSVFFVAAAASQSRVTTESRQQIEERVFLRTIEEQGGRSHASGDRPEFGPTQLRALVPFGVQMLRIGLTPTSFSPSGGLVLEYDTAAAHNHVRVEITASGAFELLDLVTGTVLFSDVSGPGLRFVKAGEGIAVSAADASLGSFPGPLRVRPADDSSILVVSSIRRINRQAPLVNGAFPLTSASYRGELEVFASTADPTKLRLVNVVDLEDYVPGVVVNESLATFHVEALKAQAVAARGYALANLGRFADRGFDIDDSTLSQVYRGQSSETDEAVEAARASMGLVATRDGRIVPALYSSSMGGHTESNEYVFPNGPYPGTNVDPALRGIHDSEAPLPVDLTTDDGVRTFYSTVYPTSHETHPTTGRPLTSLHHWVRERSAAEILARLKESFGVPSSARSVSDVRTTLRGDSGRMMRVVVTGDWGSTTITGWSTLRRFATVSGVSPGGTGTSSAPNSPSTFVLTRDAAGRVASVLFYGGGFGHNVGMSQYGAHGRALRGQSVFEILAGYYTGADISTPPWVTSAAVGRASMTQTFVAVSGRAVLVVENHGLTSLGTEINGWRFVIHPAREELYEVDVSRFLRKGVNTLGLMPEGEPEGYTYAVAAVRLEYEKQSRRERR